MYRFTATAHTTSTAGTVCQYTAAHPQTALPALLGMAQQLAGWASLHGESITEIALEMVLPWENTPTQYVMRWENNEMWKVFVAGGLLADGGSAQHYPNAPAAVLAACAQAAALLLNP